jgi:predicted dehydrogenase
MTERHEITSILQRALIGDEAIFGTVVAGAPDEPGVFMESVHYLKKLVAGVPLRRPAWFFDVREQGEALSDVGTHLIDLVLWMLRPERGVLAQDVCLNAGRRWPTIVSRSDFKQITGEPDFPRSLHGDLVGDDLHYASNTHVRFALAGVHVQLNVLWDMEAAAGAGDTHLAVFRGSLSRVEVRQGRQEKFQPELYVIPNRAVDLPLVRRALDLRLRALQTDWPGVGMVDLGVCYRVTIPAAFRVGHEAHFAQVTRQFLRYVLGQESMPAWEKPNMLAKYLITTRGAALAGRASDG